VIPLPFRQGQHFGATLDWATWHDLADRLRARSIEFQLEPTVDEVRGAAKMMMVDPDGYLIEVKACADPSVLRQPQE
jgi:Predicted dioxygenase of extradiol dioxygenase family